MDRRIIAMTACAAAMALMGMQPAQASQCTQACDKAFQQCSGSGNADSQACLPKWGQCKKACAGPVAGTTPAAKVTQVAQTTTKTTTAKTSTKSTKTDGKHK